MKISRRSSGSAPQGPQKTSRGQDAAGRPEKIEKAERPEAAEASVGVSLSDTTQLVSTARDAIASLPDIRTEKVQEIRLSVDDGSYKVESEKVARKLVNESLRESALRGRA